MSQSLEIPGRRVGGDSYQVCVKGHLCSEAGLAPRQFPTTPGPAGEPLPLPASVSSAENKTYFGRKLRGLSEIRKEYHRQMLPGRWWALWSCCPPPSLPWGRAGRGRRCLGARGLFILGGISVLNSSLFEESRGFGASKHNGPIGRPQPVPTSCISVTAKNTAHQLPAPCSPGEFLPGREMPDSGDRVCAAPPPPRPRAQRGTPRGRKARGTLARGGGWGWGLPRGGGGGTRLSPQLTRDGGGRREAQSQRTSAPGRAPRLAQSHAPWVGCRRGHQGGRGGEGGLGSPTPSPARLWAAAPSAKPSLPDRPGLGPRPLQPARPTVPVCLCLQSGPNRNLQHRHPSASRGPKPDSGGKETAGRQNRGWFRSLYVSVATELLRCKENHRSFE